MWCKRQVFVNQLVSMPTEILCEEQWLVWRISADLLVAMSAYFDANECAVISVNTLISGMRFHRDMQEVETAADDGVWVQLLLSQSLRLQRALLGHEVWTVCFIRMSIRLLTVSFLLDQG